MTYQNMNDKIKNFKMRFDSLRDLITMCKDLGNIDDVYSYLDKVYPPSNDGGVDRINVKISYGKVMDELLTKPKTNPFKYPIHIYKSTDDADYSPYYCVDMLNLNYEVVPEGLKPWGCVNNEEPPIGHYNVNAEKYSKYFSFGFIAWSEIIDTPIVVDESALDLDNIGILAEILWELTFYGFSELHCNENLEDLKKRLDESLEEMKENGGVVYNSIEEFLEDMKKQ